VQLKLKRADFTLVTRRATLGEATDDGQVIYRQAAVLLAREPARPTRLTGVSAQNLVAAAASQMGLFVPQLPEVDQHLAGGVGPRVALASAIHAACGQSPHPN
jgi:DNA polymerase-4